MTPRLSGHFSIFGLVFFALKSVLEIARQWSREKFAILTLKPRSHVRILIYRTWAISAQKLLCTNSQTLYTAVSHSLINQSKLSTLKLLKKLKPTKNSTWPYLNEILAHFISEMKTKGYDVLGVNLFPHKLMGGMRFPRKKRSKRSLLHYWAPVSRLVAPGLKRSEGVHIFAS